MSNENILLSDVLLELVKERARRIELEEMVTEFERTKDMHPIRSRSCGRNGRRPFSSSTPPITPPPPTLPQGSRRSKLSGSTNPVYMLSSSLRNETTTHKKQEDDELTTSTIISNFLNGLELNKYKDSTALSRFKAEECVNAKRNLQRELIALQTERDGLADMVHALTDDNDAVSLALKESSKGDASTTLPLHAVRVLEAMPWDERAQQLASVLEEVYEWEVYDTKSETWTNKYKAFPPSLQNLPVIKPGCVALPLRSDEKHKDDGSSTTSNVPKVQMLHKVFEKFVMSEGMMTDFNCTHILNLKEGYSLPGGGTWEWIGNWTVDKSFGERSDDDTEEWSYVDSPEILSLPRKLECNSSTGYSVEKGNKGGEGLGVQTRRYRRRRWTRLRVLTSYPSISKRTKGFLSLLAQHARLAVKATKLAEQVLGMHTELVEMNELLYTIKREKAEVELAQSNEIVLLHGDGDCNINHSLFGLSFPSCDASLDSRIAHIANGECSSVSDDEGTTSPASLCSTEDGSVDFSHNNFEMSKNKSNIDKDDRNNAKCANNKNNSFDWRNLRRNALCHIEYFRNRRSLPAGLSTFRVCTK